MNLCIHQGRFPMKMPFQRHISYEDEGVSVLFKKCCHLSRFLLRIRR